MICKLKNECVRGAVCIHWKMAEYCSLVSIQLELDEIEEKGNRLNLRRESFQKMNTEDGGRVSYKSAGAF